MTGLGTVVPTEREAVLARLWREGRLLGRRLVARGGERLAVVYRGRPGAGRGPDFREAVLATEGAELLRGDIEFHLRASHWRRHGHHRDPAYNGVILHLVLVDDEAEPTRRQDGGLVRRVCLNGELSWLAGAKARREASFLPWEPCRSYLQRRGAMELGQRLDEAGEARFEEKAARFEGELEGEEDAQVLYQGLMGALGYSQNQAPFAELARRLPLQTVEGFLFGKQARQAELMARSILLGGAGLLASLGGRGPLQREDILWCELGLEPLLERRHWRRDGLRPANGPERRLAGAAHLLVRYRELGLVGGLAGRLEAEVKGSPRGELERGLVVAAPDGGGALIGRGRAREMVVNVVLPFFWAWGRRQGRRELVQGVRLLYANQPKTPDNALLRQMTGQVWGQERPQLLNSARRQQGMLHLYRCCCTQGRCAECALSSPGR